MNSEISSLTAAIVGLAIADAAALTLSVVAVAVAGPFGAVTWIFTGAAIAAATAYIVIDSLKIKSLQAEISQTQKAMDDYTADIAALQLTSNTFANLSKQASAVEANLQYILTVWQSLNEDLREMALEMKDADSKYSSEDWEAIKADFQVAINLWNSFIGQVRIYKISDISGNTCRLTPGMSQQEVDKAVKAGAKVSLINYLCNNTAA
jgi:hypothetical protein